MTATGTRPPRRIAHSRPTDLLQNAHRCLRHSIFRGETTLPCHIRNRGVLAPSRERSPKRRRVKATLASKGPTEGGACPVAFPLFPARSLDHSFAYPRELERPPSWQNKAGERKPTVDMRRLDDAALPGSSEPGWRAGNQLSWVRSSWARGKEENIEWPSY